MRRERHQERSRGRGRQHDCVRAGLRRRARGTCRRPGTSLTGQQRRARRRKVAHPLGGFVVLAQPGAWTRGRVRGHGWWAGRWSSRLGSHCCSSAVSCRSWILSTASAPSCGAAKSDAHCVAWGSLGVRTRSGPTLARASTPSTTTASRARRSGSRAPKSTTSALRRWSSPAGSPPTRVEARSLTTMHTVWCSTSSTASCRWPATQRSCRSWLDDTPGRVPMIWTAWRVLARTRWRPGTDRGHQRSARRSSARPLSVCLVAFSSGATAHAGPAQIGRRPPHRRHRHERSSDAPEVQGAASRARRRAVRTAWDTSRLG